MISKAYWIDRNGKAIKLTESTHILQIMKNPHKFGLTKAYIESVYKKHDEPIGGEGDAREEIIITVIKKGFIRIRLYKQWWSVTVNKVSRYTKGILSKWAEVEQRNKLTGQHFPVKISSVDNDKVINVAEIKDVWFGVYEDEIQLDKDVILEFVEFEYFGFTEAEFNKQQFNKIRRCKEFAI